MAVARDVLSLLVKQHILHDTDVSTYKDYIPCVVHALQHYGVPACESIGTRTNTACGSILCPFCEFARRWQFARCLAWNLRWDVDGGPIDPYEVAIVQHIVDSPSLLGLADTTPGAFHDPSILRRFRYLDGLLGWIVNVEWQGESKTWKLIRTAVTTVKPRKFRKTSALTVQTILDFPPIDERSMNDNIGEKSAIVLAAITNGNTMFSINDALNYEGFESPVVDAGIALRQMRESGKRLHLLSCISPRNADERTKMQECGY